MARTRTPTAETPGAEIARAVRAEMARAGVTQENLADMLGWTQRKLSYRLTGDSPFRAEELVAIATALGVPAAQLLPPAVPATDSPTTVGAGGRGTGASVPAGDGRQGTGPQVPGPTRTEPAPGGAS